jgi:hypothetical protein
VTARPSADSAPEEFRRALSSLRTCEFRPELDVEEAPAPQRLAPHAVALTAEVYDGDDELGHGRLVVLHDPEGVEAWEGTFRVVAFAKARLEPEMAADPLLTEVGWAWLEEALSDEGAAHVALGGTVTRTTSESFAAMDDRPLEGQVEIRASWTPIGADLASHARAWASILATACGLAPVPPGVVTLPRARGRS